MSRKLSDLRPLVRQLCEQHIEACENAGLPILVYCTYRSPIEQAILFRQSHSKAKVEAKIAELSPWPYLAKILIDVGPQKTLKKPVTNAGPGQSMHQYGLAYDCVPMNGGKPLWDDLEAYNRIGFLGEKIGLNWAGRWRGALREMAHFQFGSPLWMTMAEKLNNELATAQPVR